MNPRVIIVLVSLAAAAALLFVLALSDNARQLTVVEIVSKRWPPADVPADRVAAAEVAVVGYCAEVDRPVNPTLLRMVDQPPEKAGFDQPSLIVDIAPGAKLPEEVRQRAWTRATGTYDPRTGRFTASRIEMKCPSAEEAKLPTSQR